MKDKADLAFQEMEEEEKIEVAQGLAKIAAKYNLHYIPVLKR